MKEFFRRLFSRPAIAFELITASLFISILALASPLFVMQVLNRYVAQGVDATLMTLTSGVLVAIILELAFRQARAKLADRISTDPDEEMSAQGYTVLTKSRLDALEKVSPDMRREVLNSLPSIEQAYNSSNITAILDVPFALVFVIVLYIMEPAVALIVAFFLITVFVGGLIGAASMNKKTNDLSAASGASSAMLSTAIRESETVRAFNAAEYLRSKWDSQSRTVQFLRRELAARQGLPGQR